LSPVFKWMSPFNGDRENDKKTAGGKDKIKG